MVSHAHFRAMNELNKEELLSITGGSTTWLTATFVNAIARCLDTILEIGRSIGSSISRTIHQNTCS